jgi:hypothetical protein
MRYERKHYREIVEESKAERLAEAKTEARRMAQATPEMEKLTGDPHWNLFLQLLQGQVEETEQQLEQMREMLGLHSMPADSLVELNTRVAACRSRIFTLREVMDLPKQLMEQGQEALGWLKATEQS